MRISKWQLAIITILNVVIAALVAVIFLTPVAAVAGGDPVKPPDSGDVTTPPIEEHIKLREPIEGKIPDIVRETRLMGSGDETVVAVHFANGVTYIFGNATVGDLDFDSYGGFLCTVGANGNITGFAYFDGRLTAVGAVDGGFAAATVSGADGVSNISRLYSVDFDGTVKNVAVLDGEAVDIMSVEGGKAAVVTKPDGNSFKLTEYAVSDELWAAEYNTRISSGYSLDYFDCFRLGDGYILAARAYSLPRYDSVVFYTFQAGGDASAHFYGGSGDGIMQPYAVMPYEKGYLALCRRDGVAAIVTVDYAFMSYRRDLLGFAFVNARLLYSDNKYYACFECAEDRVVYELDELLNRRSLSAANGMIPDCAVSSNGTLLAGNAGQKMRVTDISGSRVLELDIADGIVYGGYRTTDGLTVLILSSTGGSALSKPTAGRDVYIAALRI